MSFSSNGGLSFKLMNDTKRSSAGDSKFEFEEDKNSCCYGKCFKKPYFNGRLVCGVFKSRFDSFSCFFLSLLFASLVSAVIIPVLLNWVINDAIVAQVVIDSSASPNYEAWRTNVNGPGDEVSSFFSFYLAKLINYIYFRLFFFISI